MTTAEIITQARELRELQVLIEEAQQEAEAIKDDLKAAMGDAEELRAGEYKITWKSVTSYICSGVPTGDDYQHSTVVMAINNWNGGGTTQHNLLRQRCQ